MPRLALVAIACAIACGSAVAQPGLAKKVYAHYVPWHPPSHARPDRTANEWTHLAGAYDGEALTLYVNGVAVATTPCAGASGTASTGIGRNPLNGGSIFTGLIDDMRIAAAVLTAFGLIDPTGAGPAEPR